ncbi:MAG: hypothetical protein KAI43_07175 [Candidatus Aureabacteria bacterium]|nr:hypothetical protein [Candidatus Auribacterota bacterium]
MHSFKAFILFIFLVVVLFGASFVTKSYLSANEKSIVKEFISIPFSMQMSKLFFMNQHIAASQYYQFLAVVYCTTLNYPHYHLISKEGKEEHHNEQKCDCNDHDHHHSEGSAENKYVAYTHGSNNEDIYFTQEKLDEMLAREENIKQYTSNYIDTKYFYDLIDLSNALDPDNDYVLFFGRGWVLNVNMARQMVGVLEHSYERTPKWRTMFDAGWIALYALRDYERARKYFEKAMKHEDVPSFVVGIYTHSFSMDKKYESAIKHIAYQMLNTKDHGLRTRLEKKLKWYQDLFLLNRGAIEFEKRYKRPIQSLKDLVNAGFFKVVPEDCVGKGFVWDSKNSEVISKNIYDLVNK